MHEYDWRVVNLPDLTGSQSYNDSYFVASNASTQQELLTIDSFTDCGLQQISNIKNHLNRQLDLIYASDVCNCTVEESSVSVCNIDNYHPPLSLIFSYENGIMNTPADNTYRYNFRKADFTLLDNLLNDIDFVQITNQEDINVGMCFWFLHINLCLYWIVGSLFLS